MAEPILVESQFEGLTLTKRGKVRDVYEVDHKLLIVASDRMSAFDVVMDDPIPDKGKILTAISLFWFKQLDDVVENHVLSADPSQYPASCRKYTARGMHCARVSFRLGLGGLSKDWRRLRHPSSQRLGGIRETALSPIHAFYKSRKGDS
jgi:hypothetical protein